MHVSYSSQTNCRRIGGKDAWGWPVGELIDNGKSAFAVETLVSKGDKAALKMFDHTQVDALLNGRLRGFSIRLVNKQFGLFGFNIYLMEAANCID
jgi:hypothetical protein